MDDQPAISADRDWILPANAVRDLALSGNPFWYRLLVDEKDNILATTYEGRYPPDHLRNAIRFRDGTCRYPGCTKKAANCDLDHRQPLPDGPTSGENLWALCRHHHKLKTFGHAEPIRLGNRWVWRIRATQLRE
ncbi:HNH endonuclease signature motif containing protein [Aeromicrobium phragmitis]|uniref:HNH endonuclease signature motif containing protein n=1 Tax=Aeromicrobium phragmitis TaxID=2478914 RepID=UPI00105EA2D3|nr:HNH endonuclease signature motif containing protein [Aeromicrobium phragmitis]